MKTLLTETALREQLRNIVTRNGKSGRIPEILEAELDDLVALIKQYGIDSRVSEVESMGVLAVDSPEILLSLSMRLVQLKQKETKS